MFHKFASRRDFLKAGGAITLVSAGLLPARAAPDRSRIALVVGNNSYPRAPLNNAINDAKAVGALLERAGFDVTLKTDVGRDALRQAAKEFGAMARGSEAREVFFYYAGHGAQMDWRNYLLPVDARVAAASDLPAQCLELGALLNDLSKAKGKVFVLILDACRDNPFGTGFQPAQKGLSQFDAPVGSLLAFSTAPGNVAADGSGVNSLYTESLIRELAVKGVRLEDALKRVRLAVRVASKGSQVPWESTSLESDVFVFPAASSKLTEAELEAEYENEIAVWNRIKASKQPEDWVAYLRQYPSGKFNEVAQNRLSYLLRVEEERRALAQAQLVAIGQVSPTLAPSEQPAPPRPELELGPGISPPVLMRPSPNPASAGTYALNRRYSVGDEVVYAVSEPVFGTRQPDRRYRLTHVDEDADRVEFNGGKWVVDTLGNLIKNTAASFDPRIQENPVELQIGRKWTTRYRFSGAGKVTEAYRDYRVVGRERIRVPAGEFEAFRLEAEGWWKTGVRLVIRTWVVPGLNFFLKYQIIRH
ncbi:MAG TPA: caspase family protein, partial [Casimicrobiaceae bacterium]|nr:caspase family protein [Casimicrobiaceae bacterium]